MESKEATPTMVTCNKTCINHSLYKDNSLNTINPLTMKTCSKESQQDPKLLLKVKDPLQMHFLKNN